MILAITAVAQKMEPEPTIEPSLDQRIPARNRRQAMDWSLVLASQGIAHVVDAVESGWVLGVSATDHARALAEIQQYRVENRHWRWRQPVLQPGLFFDWASVVWVALTIVFYWWSTSGPDLRSAGRMDGTALFHGEWWRLFTATLLHADLGHLATNAVFGLVFLGLAMGRFGPGVGLLAAYLGGVAGNGLGWWVKGTGQLSLGASGVVMAGLGLVAAQPWGLLKQRNPHAWRLFAGGILSGGLLFVLLGLNPETDVLAHTGGFVAGMLFGSGLALAPKVVHKPLVNLAAGIIFVGLVIVPWLRVLGQVR